MVVGVFIRIQVVMEVKVEEGQEEEVWVMLLEHQEQ